MSALHLYIHYAISMYLFRAFFPAALAARLAGGGIIDDGSGELRAERPGGGPCKLLTPSLEPAGDMTRDGGGGGVDPMSVALLRGANEAVGEAEGADGMLGAAD
jgi:hypothetical protein